MDFVYASSKFTPPYRESSMNCQQRRSTWLSGSGICHITVAGQRLILTDFAFQPPHEWVAGHLRRIHLLICNLTQRLYSKEDGENCQLTFLTFITCLQGSDTLGCTAWITRIGELWKPMM